MDQWIFAAFGVAVVCVIAFWQRRSEKTRSGVRDNNANDSSSLSAADLSWAPGHHHGSSGDFGGGHHGASGDFGGGDSGGDSGGGGDGGGGGGD